MTIACRIVGLAALLGSPIGMIFTAGTGWFFVIWGGGSLVGAAATMLAEYTERPA